MKTQTARTGYRGFSKATRILKRFLQSNIGFSYTGQIFVIAASMFQMLLINIYLGLDQYGILVTLISIFSLTSLLTHFKTKEVVTRFLVTEINRNSSSQIYILKLGIFLDTLSLSIMLCVSYFLVPEFIKLLKIDFENYEFVTIFSLYFGINLLQGSFTGYFQAVKKFNVINSLLILQSILIISTIGIHIIFFAFKLRDVINSLLFAAVITTLVYVVLLYLDLKRKDLSENHDSSMITKNYFGLSFKLYLAGFAKMGYVNLENPILLYFTNLETVGLYQTIKKVFIPINFLIQPYGMLTASNMIDYFDTYKKEKLHKLILENTKYLIFACIPLYVLIFGLSEYYLTLQSVDIVDLGGELYSILVVQSVYSFLPVISWWSGNFIILYRPTITIYTNLVASITNIVFPVVVLGTTGYNTLFFFVLALLVARVPTWGVAFIMYSKYRSEKFNQRP